MERPVTTLFMLMSVDGKISTGASDVLDVDRDYPTMDGVKEGLHQYYEIEQTTDLWSLNTGRVQAKLGVNEKDMPPQTPVSFVLIDNSHLNEHGVRFFCELSKQFVLITTNPDHPAFKVKTDNLGIILQEELCLEKALVKLKEEYGCDRITIQSGGTMNGLFLREKLFDYVDIVVAPVLVGGKDTSTLIDGESITTREDLGKLGALRLIDCEKLEDSYIRLKYEVIK
ncbi:MAG: dihydrofolate reductase family protein [Clostridia bacterium]|nr:dihydrofolate reductase family protein [Clostridia bacterium]